MYKWLSFLPATFLLSVAAFPAAPVHAAPDHGQESSAVDSFSDRLSLLAAARELGGPVSVGIFDEFESLLAGLAAEGDPELALLLDPASDGWRDVSLAAILEREDAVKAAAGFLHTLDPATLAASEREDRELLLERLEQEVAGQRFREEFLPLSIVHGPQFEVPRALAAMPRRTLEDYERVLDRLAALPGLVDQTLVLLRLGLDRGVTPPRPALEEVPRQVLELIPAEPHESPLLAPFRSYPSRIPFAEQERLRKAAEATYRLRVRPAFEKLQRYLSFTYIPGARTSISLAALPDGEAWYAHRVRRFTGGGRTPRELHERGLAEVERLRAAMAEVIAETGFRGDFAAFGELLRTHPQFRFEGSAALLRSLRDRAKRADGELPRFFSRLPRLPYGVETLPRWLPRPLSGARDFLYYEPGSLRAGRAARVFVDVTDLAARPRWRLDALFLHEAVPGRHLVSALWREDVSREDVSREDESLPWYRRHGGSPALALGWPVYAQSLGAEMGFYADPYARFGELEGELWHVLLLVADTGIHAMDWSLPRAVGYLADNAVRSRRDAAAAVDRILAEPGRALAAPVGAFELHRLRRRAEADLGPRFDLRAFHDAVLDSGTVPLEALERRILRWIDQQGSEPGG